MAASSVTDSIIKSIQEQVSYMKKDVDDLKLVMNGNAFMDVPGVILRMRVLEDRMGLLLETTRALEDQEGKIDVLGEQVDSVDKKLSVLTILLVIIGTVGTLNLGAFLYIIFFL